MTGPTRVLVLAGSSAGQSRPKSGATLRLLAAVFTSRLWLWLLLTCKLLSLSLFSLSLALEYLRRFRGREIHILSRIQMQYPCTPISVVISTKLWYIIAAASGSPLWHEIKDSHCIFAKDKDTLALFLKILWSRTWFCSWKTNTDSAKSSTSRVISWYLHSVFLVGK